MHLFRWTMLATVTIALGACSEALKPGRCDQTSDCVAMSAYGAGYVCNLDPTPQGDGQCVLKCVATTECQGGRVCDFDSHGIGRCLFPAADGGIDGTDAGDGGGEACTACGGSTPVCVAGTCVECSTSSDCNTDPKEPICDTTAHTCGACSADSQCADKLGPNPGVCMIHQDGRCATDAETVYVQNTTGCDDAGGATASVPLCSLAPVPAIVMNSDTRTLIVVRGTGDAATTPFARSVTRAEASIVGQQSAVVSSGARPALDIRGGLFYVRGVQLRSSSSVGISASPGTNASATLRLDHVTVDSCMGGGILLDGAAFDIRNTTVTNNGPGQQGTTSWGGILVNGLAPAGQKNLDLVTIENNRQVGLACAGEIFGSGVFVSDNAGGVQVQTTCNLMACSSKSSTCGAQ